MPLTNKQREALDEFDRLRTLLSDNVRSIIGKYHVGLYVHGRPGTGKTFTVEETLEQSKCSYTPLNGSISASGLFDALRENKDGVLFIDDVATMFKDRTALQYLQAALSGKPGKPRRVTRKTNKGTETIDFSGGIIAVSNEPLNKKDKVANSVASRMLKMAYEPTDEMIEVFMITQSTEYENLSSKECLEATRFVIMLCKEQYYIRPDLRMMTTAWDAYRMWKAKHSKSHWKNRVRENLKEYGSDDLPKHHKQYMRLAVELYEQDLTKAEKIAEFNKQTDHKGDMAFYRWLKKAGVDPQDR